MEIEYIDYTTEKGPFWLVWVDDTPICPELPLPLFHALRAFRSEVEEAAEGNIVELRQCNAEDLEWAGVKQLIEEGEE